MQYTCFHATKLRVLFFTCEPYEKQQQNQDRLQQVQRLGLQHLQHRLEEERTSSLVLVLEQVLEQALALVRELALDQDLALGLGLVQELDQDQELDQEYAQSRLK